MSPHTHTNAKPEEAPETQHDAVFGEITSEGPNYRAVNWMGTAVLIMKTQIGLGVLSIPAAFDALGIVPGVICLLAVGGITTWSDYMVGVFKLRYPQVYGLDDVGELMFGRIGREFFSVCFCLYWIFVTGSAMLGLSIGLNAVSTHATCTAVFVVVAAILGFCFASIQTLGRISWLAWIGLISLVSAIFTVTVAVGVQDRPAAAPADAPWTSDYKITNNPSFEDAITAVSTMVMAYSATPAYFNIVAEMRDPREFPKALAVAQTGMTIVYLVVGCVVYYYCGSYVASPALGSAGGLLKKISYGIALPGLLVTIILTTHLPSKFIFIRMMRGTKHLASNTMIHWAAWLGCTGGVSIIAYIIASAIPVFGGLVSLVGALLGTLIAFQPMACMWFYENWTEGRLRPTLGWYFGVAWSVFVFVSGCFLTVGGTYGAAVSIANTYKEEGGSSWSCADNSNSV